MSKAMSKFTMKMSKPVDYWLVKTLAKTFDTEDRWPVKAYDDEKYMLIFKEVNATKEDIEQFATYFLEDSFKKIGGIYASSNPKVAEATKDIQYEIEVKYCYKGIEEKVHIVRKEQKVICY